MGKKRAKKKTKKAKKLTKRKLVSVVHLGTLIQTTFGIVDSKGNVLKKIPTQVESDEFTQEVFITTHLHMQKRRAQLKKELKKGLTNG